MVKEGTLAKGDTVFVPRTEWPTIKPPKGQTGWFGKVVQVHSDDEINVKFKGDNGRYTWSKKTLLKWQRDAPAAPESDDESDDQGPSSPSPKKNGSKSAKKLSNTHKGGTSKKTAEPQIPKVGGMSVVKPSSKKSQLTPNTKNKKVTREELITEIKDLFPEIAIGDLRTLRNMARDFSRTAKQQR